MLLEEMVTSFYKYVDAAVVPVDSYGWVMHR